MVNAVLSRKKIWIVFNFKIIKNILLENLIINELANDVSSSDCTSWNSLNDLRIQSSVLHSTFHPFERTSLGAIMDSYDSAVKKNFTSLPPHHAVAVI